MGSEEREIHLQQIEEFLSADDLYLDPVKTLEVLLRFAISGKDAYNVSEALLDHFGSLSAVMDASWESLIRVPGINSNAATILKLIPMVMRRYGMQKLMPKDECFDTIEKVGGYCAARYFGATDEVLSIMLMDESRRMLGFEIIQVGSLSYANVNCEKIAELLYAYDARCFVLVHNHPGGVMMPSKEDISVTEWIMKRFDCLDKTLLEHFIVHGNSYMPIINMQRIKMKWHQDTEKFSRDGLQKIMSNDNKKSKSDAHTNHRERLKKRFHAEGLDNFEFHEILELILYYSIRRGDTNPTGHSLMSHFGTFTGVMDASEDELSEVPGVGAQSAKLINVIRKAGIAYAMDKESNAHRFDSMENIADYCVALYKNYSQKIFSVLLFSNGMTLLGLEILRYNPFSSYQEGIKELAEIIFRYNAAYYVIVYNAMKARERIPSIIRMNEAMAVDKFFSVFHRHMYECFVISDNSYVALKKHYRLRR